jgi:hypothetical protein
LDDWAHQAYNVAPEISNELFLGKKKSSG